MNELEQVSSVQRSLSIKLPAYMCHLATAPSDLTGAAWACITYIIIITWPTFSRGQVTQDDFLCYLTSAFPVLLSVIES